jgi:heme-degrading monooxygenase HmoA
MPVLVRHTTVGMNTATYDQVSPQLIPLLKQQPGFIMHAAYDHGDDLIVSELWESQEQHDKWFDENVVPNVPAEIRQEVIQIHNLVQP